MVISFNPTFLLQDGERQAKTGVVGRDAAGVHVAAMVIVMIDKGLSGRLGVSGGAKVSHGSGGMILLRAA